MWGRLGIVAAATAAFFSSAAVVHALETGETSAWSERVQVIYQPDQRTVARKKVRVWNPEPAKNLDFVWEPSAGATIAPDGTVSGDGKLVWRVRGSASYDAATIYSTYTGAMKDGRPHGKGRLVYRTGEWFDGTFADGLPNGHGVHLDVAGNRYEGEFVDGRFEGRGRYAAATGDIYTGPFAGGLKHGRGTTKLAGGTVYESEWSHGKESGRPAVFADATLGGLLLAQSDGGDAGKVDISVIVEPRMTAKATEDMGVAYQHLVRDTDIAIYPLDKEMNDLWNGTVEISTYSSYVFEDRDWEYSPAFVEVDLNTTDGSRVQLDKLELQVASSEAYRKPMLSLMQHVGCVGFRPSFSIKNDGWGEARDMKMTVKFTGSEPGGPESRAYTRDVGTFDKGIDVALKDVFDEAGVDTSALEGKRFPCQSSDALNVCRSQVFNEVGFGEVADYVWGEDKLFTTAAGTFDYNWVDDSGKVTAQSEQFRVAISLAKIEVPLEAECGAGFGGSPEALRYQDVRLPIGQSNYAVNMPLRGNKNISSYTARLKMQSDPGMSSYHQFSVAATFADGSVRKSKPVSLFYLKPRLSDYAPTTQLPACYLPEGSYGC